MQYKLNFNQLKKNTCTNDLVNEDEQLIQKIQNHDQNAFEKLVQRHTQKFYRLAYHYTHDEQISQDIVQEAFIKIWQKPYQFQSNKNAQFTTWFYRVIVNLSLDSQRKKKKFKSLDNHQITDQKNTEDQLMKEQQYQILKQAIDKLPRRQKQAIYLNTYQALSRKEAANIMQTSLKAFESLLMRAKQNLKKQLEA